MLRDTQNRPLANLRLSVTDRCNLRCQYCMPEQDYIWLPREDILQFEEIDRLVDVFRSLGVRKVRLTGGEPLLRKDLPVLIERLAAKPGLDDLAMTTNGVLLASMAKALRHAGLHRLTISLDTLRRDRFVQLARYDELNRVLEGIEAATPLFPGFKIDTVVIRSVNDDELIEMVEFAKARGAEIRSSNTWTSGAPPVGASSRSSRATRCWPGSASTTAPWCQSWKSRLRPLRAIVSATAQQSESSRQPPRRFARIATGVA